MEGKVGQKKRKQHIQYCTWEKKKQEGGRKKQNKKTDNCIKKRYGRMEGQKLRKQHRKGRVKIEKRILEGKELRTGRTKMEKEAKVGQCKKENTE